MQKLFKTQGIVLNKKPWREADLLFSILTEDFGKIRTVAVGCRKIKSKLAGHTNAPGVVEILFAAGKNFKKLTHACLTEQFAIADETDFYYYSTVLELMDKALPEDEKNQRVFELAIFVLRKITSEKNIEVKKFWLNFFIIKLLSFCGFALKEQTGFGAIQKIVNADYRNFQIRKSENRQLFFLLKRQAEFCLEREIKSLAGFAGE